MNDKQEYKNIEIDRKKQTFYLSPASLEKIKLMCAYNVLKEGKQNKSGLLAKAIDLLYETEIGK